MVTYHVTMNRSISDMSYDKQIGLVGTLYSCDPKAVREALSSHELKALRTYYMLDGDSTSDKAYDVARQLETSHPQTVADAKAALETVAEVFELTIDDL